MEIYSVFWYYGYIKKGDYGMGLTFRKSINLGKHIKLNLSKRGPSLSVHGSKRGSINFNKQGMRTTIGYGGLQYRKQVPWNETESEKQEQNKELKKSFSKYPFAVSIYFVITFACIFIAFYTFTFKKEFIVWLISTIIYLGYMIKNK